MMMPLMLMVVVVVMMVMGMTVMMMMKRRRRFEPLIIGCHAIIGADLSASHGMHPDPGSGSSGASVLQALVLSLGPTQTPRPTPRMHLLNFKIRVSPGREHTRADSAAVRVDHAEEHPRRTLASTRRIRTSLVVGQVLILRAGAALMITHN
eukprot:1765853-Rhodomonas_salina.3